MSDSQCPAHKVAYKYERHPHIPGRQHKYCPDCRREAFVNVDRYTPESELRERAQKLMRSGKVPAGTVRTLYAPDGSPLPPSQPTVPESPAAPESPSEESPA